MNTKILTCLLVVVAFSEESPQDRPTSTPNLPGEKIDPDWMASLETSRSSIPSSRTQKNIMKDMSYHLFWQMIDGVHHLVNNNRGYAAQHKNSHLTPDMINALENPENIDDIQQEGATEKFTGELDSHKTSRRIPILSTVFKVLTPVLGKIVGSSRRAFPVNLRTTHWEDSKGLDEEAVRRLFEDNTIVTAANNAERNMHINILQFITKKLIPGIFRIVFHVLFKGSQRSIISEISNMLPINVWKYINRRVIPEFSLAIKRIHSQHLEAAENPNSPKKSQRKEIEEAFYGQTGRFGLLKQAWGLVSNIYNPIIYFFGGKNADAKRIAAEETQKKMEAERLRKEQEMHDDLTAQEVKKHAAEIKALHAQIELLQLAQIKTKEAEAREKEIASEFSKKEFAKMQKEMMEKLKESYADQLKKQKEESENSYKTTQAFTESTATARPTVMSRDPVGPTDMLTEMIPIASPTQPSKNGDDDSIAKMIKEMKGVLLTSDI